MDYDNIHGKYVYDSSCLSESEANKRIIELKNTYFDNLVKRNDNLSNRNFNNFAA